MGKKNSNKNVSKPEEDVQDTVKMSLEEKVETLKDMGFNFQNIDILKNSSDDIVNNLILALVNLYKDKFFVDITKNIVRIYNNCKIYDSELIYKEDFNISKHDNLVINGIGNVDKKLKNELKHKDVLITEKVSTEYVYYIRLLAEESKIYLDNVRMCKVLSIDIIDKNVILYVEDADGKVSNLPQYLVSSNLDYITKLYNYLDSFYSKSDSIKELVKIVEIAEKFAKKHKNVFKYKINIKEISKYVKKEYNIENILHIKGCTINNDEMKFRITGDIRRLEDSITGEDVTDKIEELRIDSFEKDVVHFSIHGHAVYLCVQRFDLESDNIISLVQ